jgi:hypothetical protein
MKKSFLLFLIPFFVLVFSGCAEKERQISVEPVEDNSPIIFFYGEECTFCKVVEKFVAENGIREKVEFSEREIYHDEANAALFVAKAKECEIDEKDWGVPMLWSEDECLMGDQDIINFLKEKANEKE